MDERLKRKKYLLELELARKNAIEQMLRENGISPRILETPIILPIHESLPSTSTQPTNLSVPSTTAKMPSTTAKMPTTTTKMPTMIPKMPKSNIRPISSGKGSTMMRSSTLDNPRFRQRKKRRDMPKSTMANIDSSSSESSPTKKSPFQKLASFEIKKRKESTTTVDSIPPEFKPRISTVPKSDSRPSTAGFRSRTANKRKNEEDLEKSVETIIKSVQKSSEMPLMEIIDETKPGAVEIFIPPRQLVFSPPESFEQTSNYPEVIIESPSKTNSVTEGDEDMNPLSPQEKVEIMLDIDKSAEMKDSTSEPEIMIQNERGIFTPAASIEIFEPSDESLPPTPPVRSSFLQLPSDATSGRVTSLSSSEFDVERSTIQSRLSFIVREKLHHFASDLRRRTSEVLEDLNQDKDDDETSEDGAEKASITGEVDKNASLMSLIGLSEGADEVEQSEEIQKKCLPDNIDPFSKIYLLWLGIVVLAFFYNAFGIPLRSSFPYQTDDNLIYWMIMDYFCDFIYVIDMFLIKPRLIFMRGGITIRDKKELAKHYFVSRQFKLDIVCVIPFDFAYIFVGPVAAVRIGRLLKIVAFWELFDLLDSSFSNPYAIRITRTFCYMIYLIHCNACVYYMLSAWQAFGQIAYKYKGQWYLNKWVYNNQGNAYLRCFYFMAAIATKTGNNPSPTNVIEYGYMIFSWMFGVFVFALLLGQIRDIVYNANKNVEEFRSTMDKALSECKRLDLPPAVTDKVRRWFMYTWEQQKTLEEKKLVDKLPLKLQTDLALSVHYNTLSKVQMFQDADRALLRDLVLKLRPVIFLPGEMVCCKGDVGKEMYIVNQGILEVVSDTCDKVFATLSEGSVFGEISLLAIGGNNRRTANIRSKGYSTLFVLSKEDLNDVIKDYPDAQQSLKKKARQMLKKDETKTIKTKKEVREELIKKCEVSTTIPTPKMLEAVAALLPKDSSTAKELEFVMHKDIKPPLKRWSTIPDDFSDVSDTEFQKHFLALDEKSKSLDERAFTENRKN